MPLKNKNRGMLFTLLLLSSPAFAERGASPCEGLYKAIEKELSQSRISADPAIKNSFLECRDVEDEMMQSGITPDKESVARQKAEEMIANAEAQLGRKMQIRARGPRPPRDR